MEKRTYNTTGEAIGITIFIALVMSFLNVGFIYISIIQPLRLEAKEIEQTALKPSDFPDLSHEVVEIVEVEEVGKTGKASWYDYSLKNHPNYSKSNFTAASRDYPRGTKLKVCRIEINITRLKGGKWQDWPCVNVRVNDYVENPKVIIDLSSAAFSKLAALSRGLIEVEVTKIE